MKVFFYFFIFSCGWPVVHGIPRRLPAQPVMPAEAKTLLLEGGINTCGFMKASALLSARPTVFATG